MASQPAELLSKIDGKITNDKQKSENSEQDIKADFNLKEQKQTDALVDSKISKDQVPPAFIAASYIPQFRSQQSPVVVKPKVDPKQLQIFLDHIARGRQDEAEAMLKANKDLALASGDITDHAKRTFRNITGFQYAVWALDCKMWTMLLQYLPSEVAKEQAKGFKTGSWVKEYAEQTNWKNVTDAIQVYIDNYDGPWTAEQCKNHWVEQVGGAQFKLPIHVLQEYNNPNRPFEPCPKFDVNYPLQRSLPDWLEKGIKDAKFDFGILRYSGQDEAEAASGGDDVAGVAPVDWRALIRLSNTRVQQRSELVTQLLGSHLHQTKKPGGQ